MPKRTHICKNIAMSCKVENRGQGWRLYRGKTKSQITHMICPYCATELELTAEELELETLEVETGFVEADIAEQALELEK